MLHSLISGNKKPRRGEVHLLELIVRLIALAITTAILIFFGIYGLLVTCMLLVVYFLIVDHGLLSNLKVPVYRLRCFLSDLLRPPQQHPPQRSYSDERKGETIDVHRKRSGRYE